MEKGLIRKLFIFRQNVIDFQTKNDHRYFIKERYFLCTDNTEQFISFYETRPFKVRPRVLT